jgi:hypothetical protein
VRRRACGARAFPSLMRSVLTEIYICLACSCHEIEDGNARGRVESVTMHATKHSALEAGMILTAMVGHQLVDAADASGAGGAGTASDPDAQLSSAASPRRVELEGLTLTRVHHMLRLAREGEHWLTPANPLPRCHLTTLAMCALVCQRVASGLRGGGRCRDQCNQAVDFAVAEAGAATRNTRGNPAKAKS